jgi:hypothetical protein
LSLGSVADGRGGADVAGALDLGGGEGGDVGAGDGETEPVGAEESLPQPAAGGAVLGARNRTIVQSRPEVMTAWLMPTISSYARRRNVLAMSVVTRVCQVPRSRGSSTLGVPLPT